MHRLTKQSVLLLVVSITIVSQQPVHADDPTTTNVVQRPNIVWIISEDNSKHYLKHFDPDGAPTPNIEAMAREGVTFDRAFSNAPVCSVARTTLITSCYAPRIGTQFHRRIEMASMPSGIQMFPAYLRSAGYYTTNNSKEDYNAHQIVGRLGRFVRNSILEESPRCDDTFFSCPNNHLVA